MKIPPVSVAFSGNMIFFAIFFLREALADWGRLSGTVTALDNQNAGHFYFFDFRFQNLNSVIFLKIGYMIFMILTIPYIGIGASGNQKNSRIQILKLKIEKIKMSGILVIQCRHCAGAATRIDCGFTEKKIQKKQYFLARGDIFWSKPLDNSTEYLHIH